MKKLALMALIGCHALCVYSQELVVEPISMFEQFKRIHRNQETDLKPILDFVLDCESKRNEPLEDYPMAEKASSQFK